MLNSSRNMIFLFIVGNFCWTSQAGLTEGSHVICYHKNITLFGDYHTAGTDEANRVQVVNFLKALESFVQKKPLHLFLEQAGDLVKNSNVLRTLTRLVGEANPQGLTLEDAEVRKKSITARYILESAFPSTLLREDDKFFNTSVSLGELSFKKLDEEYLALIDSATAFKQTHPALNYESYDNKLWSAQIHYDSFSTMRHSLNIHPEDRILDKARQLYDDKQYSSMRHAMAEEVSDSFNELIELHLFRRIYEYPGNYVALVMGRSHMNGIEQLLEEQGATISLNHYCRSDHKNEPIFLSQNNMSQLLEGLTVAFVVKEEPTTATNNVHIYDLGALFEPSDPR